MLYVIPPTEIRKDSLKTVVYKVVAYGRWSLTRSGRYERVDCSHKARKNTSVLVGTVLKYLYVHYSSNNTLYPHNGWEILRYCTVLEISGRLVVRDD